MANGLLLALTHGYWIDVQTRRYVCLAMVLSEIRIRIMIICLERCTCAAARFGDTPRALVGNSLYAWCVCNRWPCAVQHTMPAAMAFGEASNESAHVP